MMWFSTSVWLLATVTCSFTLGQGRAWRTNRKLVNRTGLCEFCFCTCCVTHTHSYLAPRQVYHRLIVSATMNHSITIQDH